MSDLKKLLINGAIGIAALGYIGFYQGWEFALALFIVLWTNNVNMKHLIKMQIKTHLMNYEIKRTAGVKKVRAKIKKEAGIHG